MTFKRPLGAGRHPQTPTVRCLIHYVSINLLGLIQWDKILNSEYRIESSDDGEMWSLVKEETAHDIQEGWKSTALPAGSTALYWRVYIVKRGTGGAGNSALEVNLIGKNVKKTRERVLAGAVDLAVGVQTTSGCQIEALPYAQLSTASETASIIGSRLPTRAFVAIICFRCYVTIVRDR
jgi:hypothetical protein